MKKISSLLVLVLVIFNLTFTISFPFTTVSNDSLETTTVSVSDLIDGSSASEENIITLQSHFPRTAFFNQ